MTDIKFFMGLLTLLSSTEEELGLSNFSQKDKKVLHALWNHKGNDNSVDVTYDEFCQLVGKNAVSRSQYFKSIQKLQNAKLIYKIGTARSHKYQFNV